MIFSGLWLLLFVIIPSKPSNTAPSIRGSKYFDLYRQEMETFTNPLMVGFTIVSMFVVGSHLWRGISGSLQSLGLDHPVVDAEGARRRQRSIAITHRGAAVVIACGRSAGGQAQSGTSLKLGAHVPSGPITEKWDRHKIKMTWSTRPSKRKHTIIVVGTGLAGAFGRGLSLGELGCNVLQLLHSGQPRRAHSIAAGRHQRGQNYQNDGDGVFRLFRHGQRRRPPARAKPAIIGSRG